MREIGKSGYGMNCDRTVLFGDERGEIEWNEFKNFIRIRYGEQVGG